MSTNKTKYRYFLKVSFICIHNGITDCSKYGCHRLLYNFIVLLFIEEESCQEMSEESKLKSKLTEKKPEWVVSELTSEEKTSKDVDLSVPTEGEHIIISSSFYSEGSTENCQITLTLPHYHSFIFSIWNN